MYDPLAFFDCTKTVEKIPLHRGARVENTRAESNSLYGSSQSLATVATGTDYAEEYIRKEEKELLVASRICQKEADDRIEDVSLATAQTQMQDFLDENALRVYKTYDFTQHSKTPLTIKTVKDNIIQTINTEAVTIIQGPTGCGKTTQVPQYILDHCYETKKPCNIIVTQPRRIAAISIAKRVCQERNWPLGTLVGYKVGLANQISADTRLTYCTTGVLLQKLIMTKNMNDYTHIILDEVHERDQDMDFLLLVVRKLLRSTSRHVKVILMSATFNVDKFARYFSSYVGQELTPARIIDVIKSNFFKVQDFYLSDIETLGKPPEPKFDEPEVSADMMRFSVELLKVMNALDNSNENNSNIDRPAVLVFLPGIHEIEEMHNILTDETYDAFKWDIVVLHSSITSEEQHRIFDSPAEGYRRIILSTNIAESSITVPDVKYVIDFCLTKQMTTDPATNYQRLELTWASKANCAQRAGRTGRVMNGRLYRLISKSLYHRLPDENPPEITRAPLEQVVLRAKMLGMDKPKALLALALDPPDLSNLEKTILLLKEAGGLLHSKDDDDRFDGDLTDLGKVMAHLPVDIHISKMIVLGHVFSVLRESIIVGASMAVKNMFSTPFKRKLDAYKAKLIWARNSFSDCLAFLNAYTMWQRDKANGRLKTDKLEKEWALKSFLQVRVLREVDALIKELTMRLELLGIKETVGMKKVIWDHSERHFVLHVVIAGGFYPQYFVTKINNDETGKLKLLGGQDPMKTVYLQGWPANQPGMLYAKRFQQAFQHCTNNDAAKIKVTFEHSARVFIQFPQNVFEDVSGQDTPSEVSPAIYRALKARQLGQKIVIPVLNPEAAAARAEELGIKRSAPLLLSTDDFTAEQAPVNEIRPMLPDLDITHVPIVIRRVLDPGHFWACVKTGECWEYWLKIDAYVQSLDLKQLETFESAPAIGTLLLAPRETNDSMTYYRAVVQGISMETKNNIQVQVFCVDHGNTMRLRLSSLRRLPNNNPIAKLPAVVFECVLANVKPSVLNTLTGEWSTDAKNTFFNILKNTKKIYGEIYSIVNSVVHIQLICVTKDDEQINVNDLLISEGFAEKREEDHMSKTNHDYREHVLELSVQEKKKYEAMQYNQNYLTDSYVDPPEGCTSFVYLKGPYSPLEVEARSLINAGSGHLVTIADSSVNSVLLDSTLTDPQERFMVAGSIGQSCFTGKLTVRNTALMHRIPGLSALLSILFAPKIELRRNIFKTKYSGVLCGLGYDKVTHRSLFPEHDMDIDFDVEITIDDLQNINRLRHWMSEGIFVNPDGEEYDKDGLLLSQNKIKEVLFKIIDKKRDPLVPEPDMNRGKWRRYEDTLYIPPGSVKQMGHHVFQLHHALDLDDKDDVRESMAHHLTKLKEIAALSLKEGPAKTIRCELCGRDVFGVLQLRAHLKTQEHRAKVAQIQH